MDDRITDIIWSSIKLVIYSVLIIIAIKLLLNSKFEAFFSLSFASILVCCLDADGRDYLMGWVNGANIFQFLKGMLFTNDLSSPEKFFSGCAVNLFVVLIVVPVTAGIMGYFVIIVMWFKTIKKLFTTISEPSYTKVDKNTTEKNAEGQFNTKENWNEHQSEDDVHNDQHDNSEGTGWEDNGEHKEIPSVSDNEEDDEWVIVEDEESEGNK